MSQNGQTHFKDFVANPARFLKCVWPFWDIVHYKVKTFWVAFNFLLERKDSKTLFYDNKNNF